MKTLYLLRHAKSSWDHISINDFDRPLNDRGYSDAHFMGNFLYEKKIRVDQFVSSPAIRAVSTAIIFSQHLQYSADKIHIREKLYDSTVKDYLNCIAAIEKGDSVLLTGHNNTISEVAQKLSVHPVNELKTCAITAIRFTIDSWKDVFNSRGDLLFEWHAGALKSL